MSKTDYIEQTLEGLIRVHGLSRVQDDLKRILPRANWNDWQQLSNMADNINRRLKPEKKSRQPNPNLKETKHP